MDFPYVVLIEHPHEYRQGHSSYFETEEEQRAYGQAYVNRSGPAGDEGYIKVTLATITEEMN